MPGEHHENQHKKNWHSHTAVMDRQIICSVSSTHEIPGSLQLNSSLAQIEAF